MCSEDELAFEMRWSEVQDCDGRCWGEECSLCKDVQVVHGMTSYVQKWSELYGICWSVLLEKGEQVKL